MGRTELASDGASMRHEVQVQQDDVDICIQQGWRTSWEDDGLVNACDANRGRVPRRLTQAAQAKGQLCTTKRGQAAVTHTRTNAAEANRALNDGSAVRKFRGEKALAEGQTFGLIQVGDSMCQCIRR